MPYKDPQKQAAYLAKHYLDNKDLYKMRQKSSKRKADNIVDKLKETPCFDCKTSYPFYVMQFDHVRGEKIDSVSRILKSKGLEKALKEIQKCEVVCANCHAIRTWKRINAAVLKR